MLFVIDHGKEKKQYVKRVHMKRGVILMSKNSDLTESTERELYGERKTDELVHLLDENYYWLRMFCFRWFK